MLTKISFAKNDKVQLLGNNKQLAWKQTGQGVEINVPATLKAATDHVWVLKVKN